MTGTLNFDHAKSRNSAALMQTDKSQQWQLYQSWYCSMLALSNTALKTLSVSSEINTMGHDGAHDGSHQSADKISMPTPSAKWVQLQSDSDHWHAPPAKKKHACHSSCPNNPELKVSANIGQEEAENKSNNEVRPNVLSSQKYTLTMECLCNLHFIILLLPILKQTMLEMLALITTMVIHIIILMTIQIISPCLQRTILNSTLAIMLRIQKWEFGPTVISINYLLKKCCLVPCHHHSYNIHIRICSATDAT